MAIDTVHRRGQQGIRFCVDDFGTGYSSLAYLRRPPIDKLKIDPSFISGDDQSGNESTIVSAIINLAHSLGAGVVGEGGESSAQTALLAMQGCNEAQGFP